MTALRPERDSSPYGGEAAYGGADAFEAEVLQAGALQAETLQAQAGALQAEALQAQAGALQAEALQAEAFQAAIEGLSDPLTDPLPGAPGPQAASEPLAPVEPQRERYGAQGTQDVPAAPGYGDDGSARQTYGERQRETYEARPQPYEAYETFGGAAQQAYETPGHEHPVVDDVVAYEPPTADEETMALRVVEARRTAEAVGESPSEGAASAPAPGGRAARRKAANRKAAKRHGRRGGGVGGAHGAHGGAGTVAGVRGTRGARRGAQETGEAAKAEGAEGKPLTAPRSRVEARRAARANKPGTGLIASRVIGEMFITTGVLMLLFVTYQLWWSNIRAQQQAGKETSDLQQEWASGKRAPGAFEPGQGFAILHIPKLDVVVPIAEGISKSKVLDRGMVGHYDANSIKTAMPGDRTGNFGIAGHRNTHGEPFRYINRLKPGDPIVVETQDKYYIYDMASLLPVTSPSNVSVLDPIPKQAGFTKAGRYITLTTCTPEFTSKYRMIVWGKMVEERPRGEGKPDALVQ